MKTKTSLFCLFITVCLNISAIATAQAVNIKDSLALVDLYNSTNGSKWTNNKNWLAGPVKTWYGIVVVGTGVKEIILRYNKLNGILPVSIGNFSSLATLDLGHNEMLSGRIPTSIGDLANLTLLNLESCNFIGKIPTAIGDLDKLLYITLINNRLTGAIPAAIGKLKKLRYINLAINQLSDTIPSVIGSLTNLTDLYISDNLLTGIIPPSFGKLVNVVTLVLRNNRLSGIIPSALGSLTNLNYAYFDRNNLTGGIPTPLTDLANLVVMDLSQNRLSFNRNIDTTARLRSSQVLMNTGYNNFTFDGNEFLGQANKYPNIIYTPQARIPVHKHTNTLAVSAGGTLSNNTYRWYKIGRTGNMVITGDSTLHPTASGKYYATVTNSIATKLTLYTDTVTYTAPPLNDKNRITVYPNPVKDMLNINGLDANMDNNIIVSDAGGHVWLSKTVKQQSAIKLNVSKLKQGYYVLNVSDGNAISTIKLMKE